MGNGTYNASGKAVGAGASSLTDVELLALFLRTGMLGKDAYAGERDASAFDSLYGLLSG